MTRGVSERSILFIESDSNRHLGLFVDLKKRANIDVITYPNHVNVARKVLTRVSPALSFATAGCTRARKRYDKVVVVDTALARMDASVLRKLKSLGQELFVIVLNSLGASSPSFQKAKSLLPLIPSDHIYTFDRVEANRCGYRHLGLSYYSAHAVPNGEIEYDVYFAGGLKGGREKEIIELCTHLENGGLRAQFDCVSLNGIMLPEGVPPSVKVVANRWIPYESVLAGVVKAKCVVELLQHGQHAQSIRYFEAVCHNRNLLTNNPRVSELPYYDPEHMFYFSAIDDIDCARIACASMPDYGYKGEYSPLNLELLK